MYLVHGNPNLTSFVIWYVDILCADWLQRKTLRKAKHIISLVLKSKGLCHSYHGSEGLELTGVGKKKWMWKSMGGKSGDGVAQPFLMLTVILQLKCINRCKYFNSDFNQEHVAHHTVGFFSGMFHGYGMEKLPTNYPTAVNMSPLSTEILKSKKKNKSHLVTYI